MNMKEYTTEKGTPLFYDISYDLGGYNWATGGRRERGYYISIQRKRNMFCAFSDLSNEAGAVRYMLFSCNRRSSKAQERAENMAEQTVKHIVEQYNNAGIEL